MTPHTTLPDPYTELLQGFAFGVGSTVIHTTGHKRSRIRLPLASFSSAFLKIGIQSSWLWSDAHFSSAFGPAYGLVAALTASSQDRVSCERPYRARSNGATGRAVKCRSRQLQSLPFLSRFRRVRHYVLLNAEVIKVGVLSHWWTEQNSFSCHGSSCRFHTLHRPEGRRHFACVRVSSPCRPFCSRQVWPSAISWAASGKIVRHMAWLARCSW